MCRMLVAVGEFSSSKLFDAAIAMAKDQTQDHERNATLGKGSFKHQDGWGISYLDPQGKWRRFKSEAAIYDDVQVQWFRSLKTKYLMIHIRYAKGSVPALKNNHPSYIERNDVGEFVFCHNGYVPSEINYCPSFKTKSETDSEQIFFQILSLSKNKGIGESVSECVSLLDTPHGTNVILSSKDKSYVMVKESEARRYYTMHIGSNERCTIVSSEVLLGHDEFIWVEAPESTVFTLDHRNLNVSACKNMQIGNQMSGLQ